MFIEERHQAIIEIINKDGRIEVARIQDEFQVSMDSARRDLRILEEKGLLKRTHGGAISTRQVGFSKPPKMTPRDIVEVKANYLSIAMKAVSMIENNDVIFITSASVGYFMAQNIPDNIKIKIATNSIVVAEELRERNNISTILIGGEMSDKGCCYDSFAIDIINRLRFDKCFLTSAAISPSFGMSIQRSQAIAFWNAVIDSSKKTIGLFNTEKIGFDSIVSICPANKLDTLITDWEASEEDLTEFDKQGIEIIIVEK